MADRNVLPVHSLLYRARSRYILTTARFLDWAVDRLLLQKVGGGYIFIHRLLMEHFAAMDIQQNKNRAY